MKKSMAEKPEEITFERGSGNVFADLNLPDAEELHTKLRLIVAINRIVGERALTQKAAAKLLGINQPKVSALQHYKLDGFSVERLMHFVTALEYDVVIELRPRPASEGQARVLVVHAA